MRHTGPDTTPGTTPNTGPGTTPNTGPGTTPGDMRHTKPNTTPGDMRHAGPNTTPGTTSGRASNEARMLIACQVGDIRLIDNAPITFGGVA